VVQLFSLISSLLPISLFILFCTKTDIKGLWVIFFYLIVSFFSDSFLNSKWGINHTFVLWNIYTIVEYAILSLFFYLTLKLRSVRTLIVVISTIYFIVFIIMIKSIDVQYNSVLSFFSQVIILGLCLVYFFTSISQTSATVSILSPLFLVVIALLLYVACTLFLFIIANKLSAKEMDKYWGGITVYNNLLTNLLFSAAFLLYRFKRKNPIPENHTVDFTSPNDR